MVLSAMPRSSSFLRSDTDGAGRAEPSRRNIRPGREIPRSLSATWVRKCICVPLHHTKNGLPAFTGRSMKSKRRRRGFVVDRLHALLGQWAGVFDRLLADLAEARIDGRIVDVGRLGAQHAARAELLTERRVLRIVLVLGLLLGVQMVEIAEELVEAVQRRQELVLVAEMVLAELPGGIAERLEQRRDGGVLRAQAEIGAREVRPWRARCGTRSVR